MRIAVVLAGAIVLGSSPGVAALATGSAPSFARARSYATGPWPISVAIGDLNGDGKPDVATANERYGAAAGTVSVILNKGDGRFRARVDYRTGRRTESVAIGDLNGDGSPDLAAANAEASTVSVLLSRGDGSFRAKVDYPTGSEAYPSSVAIGDLNGDREPDLVTANTHANTVSVLLNIGDGSFLTKLDYATGDRPRSVGVGDLNRDGKPDLVAANEGRENNPGNTVSVLLNTGDGSFRAKVDYRTGSFPSSVAIGDLNGDGAPDLVSANASRSVSVLLSRGDGNFQAKRDYRTGFITESVAIGDLNGDGRPDLATADYDRANLVSVFVNRGDGSFQAKRDYRTGDGPYSVAIGDMNGDGKRDLVTANPYANTISVLLNAPGLCTVQDVKRLSLAAAKRTIARANCRVGKIRRAYSKRVKNGHVISQEPKFGTVLPDGSKVNLVVSRGRRHS
jgi:hypothetical protein